MKFITRFAPSPSGYLHLGNARTALFNWLAARRFGGAMRLRVEDSDQQRGNDAHIAAIGEDLKWLGLEWEGDIWRQSRRGAAYEAHLSRLRAAARVYPCFCAPEMLEIERRRQRLAGLPPRYPGTCARLPAAESARRMRTELFAWRFRMPEGQITFEDGARGRLSFDAANIGDFVLRRANGDFAFFFANAVDDADAGITHVLRGEDHTANTSRQLALLEALQLPPPAYAHIALMTDGNGGPLSKRDNAMAVRDLRRRGFLPAAIVNYLARVGHYFADESMKTLDELAREFCFSSLAKSPAKFDQAQLMRRQREAARNLSPPMRRRWLARHLPNSNHVDSDAFCAAVGDNIVLPRDADDWLPVFAEDAIMMQDDAESVVMQASGGFFAAAADALRADMEWKSFCERVKETSGRMGKELFLPLRAALTGRTDGPPMAELFKLIGMERAKARLSAAGGN